MKIVVNNDLTFNCNSCFGGKDYLNGGIRPYIKFELESDDINKILETFSTECKYSLVKEEEVIKEVIEVVERQELVSSDENDDTEIEDIYETVNEEIPVMKKVIDEITYDKSDYCVLVKCEVTTPGLVTVTMGKLTEQEIHIRELEAKISQLEIAAANMEV